MAIPISKQIAEIERELSTRKRVYPRWVDRQRLTPRVAQDRIEILEAVLATLEASRDAGELFPHEEVESKKPQKEGFDDDGF